jgi:hypothetical protein
MDAETALLILDLDQRLKGIEALSRPFSDSGPSFPTSQLFVGRRFFRTDLGLEYYWDGGNWVSTFESVVPICAQSQFSANANTAPVLVTAADIFRITRITMSALIVTTNNASNYWTIQLQAVNDAFTAFTSVMNVTTASMTPNTYYRGPQPIDSAQIAVGRSAFRLALTKTGSPGDLRIMLTVHCRFVIT